MRGPVRFLEVIVRGFGENLARVGVVCLLFAAPAFFFQTIWGAGLIVGSTGAFAASWALVNVSNAGDH